jgi:hypothetical protein
MNTIASQPFAALRRKAATQARDSENLGQRG